MMERPLGGCDPTIRESQGFQSAPRPQAEMTAMSGKKILIIDDDKQLQLGLAPRLKANGYWVGSAQSIGGWRQRVSQTAESLGQ
jgi:hypothetical protein